MRKYILTLAAAILVAGASYAQKPVNRTADVFAGGVRTSNVTLTPTSTMMNVAMDIDYSAAEVGKKESLDIVPVLTDGTNVKELPAIGLYGGRRYWNFLRNGGKTGRDFKLYKEGKAPQTEHYTANVPYESWMDNCQLLLRQTSRGCCNSTINQGVSTLASYVKEAFKFQPDFQYVQPVAEAVKNRAEQGEAYLSYAVGKSVVVKNFKDNAAEIQKITDIVNMLKSNTSEYKVKGISLKGFASPDGSYAVNERLAKARTESLKGVVSKALADKSIPVTTSYVAEDWDGVIKWLEASSIDNKDDILAIAYGELKPDAKDKKIASAYPAQYKQIKNECYPSLRRASYTVDYEVVPYVDAEEIKSKISSNPKDLSLNEFFIAANSVEKGSPEFNSIMEKALAQYPNNEVALVNAANSAMSVGDLSRAGELLSRIKDGGLGKEASYFTYAKAVYEALSGNYAKAASMFTSVKDKIPQAAAALAQLANAK
ncbi:MAG: hypothetical protein IKX26_04135 [Bacteroidales bacterium]|nr:hypothetical protein [Bacteroidales bacterium]